MDSRKYGTCFFEHYAQISLSAFLGSEFDCLENVDRPDLQFAGSPSIGIEVTRAMEQSRRAEQELIKHVSGITPDPKDDDFDWIQEYGYAYGLVGGRYIGARELPYWQMALPLRRIIESKVEKVGSGFYGSFDKMGLYVFCKDPIRTMDAYKTMNYVLDLQKCLDRRYNRLYLADVNDFFVCNLDDGLKESSRMLHFPVSRQRRRDFYLEAVRRQIENK